MTIMDNDVRENASQRVAETMAFGYPITPELDCDEWSEIGCAGVIGTKIEGAPTFDASIFVAGSITPTYLIKETVETPKKALTYDDGKEPLAWLPWAAIDEMSRVQMYGHQKYQDFNNYRKGMEVTRNCSCAMRHIRDYLNGLDTDEESGCHPLAHAMTRLAFVLQNIEDGKAIDDRFQIKNYV